MTTSIIIFQNQGYVYKSDIRDMYRCVITFVQDSYAGVATAINANIYRIFFC